MPTAKIANRRKDHLHKRSTQLVRDHGAIFIGNVSTSKLARTAMAKSALDASLGALATSRAEPTPEQKARWDASITE